MAVDEAEGESETDDVGWPSDTANCAGKLDVGVPIQSPTASVGASELYIFVNDNLVRWQAGQLYESIWFPTIEQ